MLNAAQFQGIEVLNLTEKYAGYNEDIIRNLKTPKKKEAFILSFDEKHYAEAVEGYAAIVQAMRKGEGRVMQFIAHKL